MSRKSWGPMWSACCPWRREPDSPTRSAVYNYESHRETLVCRGGRGVPAPAHRGSGRIAPGCGRLPGAVLPHGAGRPARRLAEAFPAQCGHFPEHWGRVRAASPIRSGLSGRIGHATRILSGNSHFVREYLFRPKISIPGQNERVRIPIEYPYRALWNCGLLGGRAPRKTRALIRDHATLLPSSYAPWVSRVAACFASERRQGAAEVNAAAIATARTFWTVSFWSGDRFSAERRRGLSRRTRAGSTPPAQRCRPW